MSELIDALNVIAKNYQQIEENSKILKEKITNLETINTTLQVQVNEYDDKIAEYETKITELNRNNIQLRNDFQKRSLELFNLENSNETLQKEVKRIKESIILSTENANRKGRESMLTDDDIAFIKQSRADGLTLRKIGEMIDVSHTTVANVLKSENVNNKANFTSPRPRSRGNIGANSWNKNEKDDFDFQVEKVQDVQDIEL